MAVMNISYKSESNSTNYANGTKMIHRLCQPISSQRSLFIPSEKIRKPFQDGGRYHIETSPLICGAKSMDWFLYDNGLRLEKVFLSLQGV